MVAKSDYAMSGGSATDVFSPRLDERGIPRGMRLTLANDGVWALGMRVALKDIVDGPSKTYLIGEKALDASNDYENSDEADDTGIVGNASRSFSVHSFVRYAGRPAYKDTFKSCVSCHDFGSAHPGGWNMSMADGSVRSFSYSMDIKLHRALASIYGNETWAQPE